MSSVSRSLPLAAGLLACALLVTFSCVNPDADAAGAGGAGGAGSGCGVDADCPAGQSCVSGACEQPCPALGCDPQCAGEPLLDEQGCPTCVCADCTTDADCGGTADPACVGSCEAGHCELRCGGPCVEDADCLPGESCTAGECIEDPGCDQPLCDLFCPAGYVVGADGCETCECLPACVADGDCAAPPQPGCTARCTEGQCQVDCTGCTEDATCGPAAYCQEGACVSCPPTCDMHCPTGYVHDAHGCELCECAPCQADEECPQPNTPGCSGVCNEGSCAIECLPLCLTDADCAPGESCTDGSCVAVCSCPDLFAPVCGADGVTYSNACEAGCAGVAIAHEGSCEAGCVCPDVWDPVCGLDGTTYGNGCEAACAGVAVAHAGECAAGGCTANADCARGDVCIQGSCQPPCEISCLIADPVCGTDGVDYGCGAADAECHGVRVAYGGACRHCNSDQECLAAELCTGGVCLP